MRLSGIFCMLSICLATATNGYSQKSDTPMSLHNATMREALDAIKQETGYSFWFRNEEVNLDYKVSVRIDKQNIEKTLDELLSKQNLSYTIDEHHIIVYKKDKTIDLLESKQQTRRITGIVTDEYNDPVIGANVKVKNSIIGSITDMDGNFTLEVPENAVLQISYIGYIQQEVPVNNQTNIRVVLRENAESLEEVVVIGYGTVKKSDLTGSVGSVALDKVNMAGVSSADRALQGQIAGVVVNARTGQPGETMMIRVRGGNSLAGGNEPLYVIDGLPVEKMTSDINPEDILSIEVLKDASSTAIYGSRGANGVVMITTKRGTQQGTQINYNGYAGISQLRKKIDLLGKDDYVAMLNEVAQNDGSNIGITPAEAALLPDNDWQKLAYQNAFTHSHQLSVSSGNEISKIYTSFNYLNQEGIIKGSGYDRLGIRINGDQQITKNLSLNANVAYSYGNLNQANSNADGYGAIAFTTLALPPIQEIMDENGNYTTFKGTPWGGTNPVGMYNQYKDKINTSTLLANISLNYTIIKDLVFRMSAGTEINSKTRDRYIPIGLSAGGGLDGDALKEKSDYYSIINENILTYDKQFSKKHKLNLVGGATFQTYRYNMLRGTSKGFLRDIYETNNLGVGSDPGIPTSDLNDYKMVSFLGRANYNLMERYIFTVTARYDGSSKFSKNHKFAFFPSAAVAWRVSQEEFMQDISWLDNLKIRASIGQTGNQGIEAYKTQAILKTSQPVFANGKDIGFQLSSMPNDDLKWETTTQTDIGIDLGFFGSRINLTIDYYWKQTRDLLYNATLPPSSGYSSMLRNLGRIDNKGLEISLQTVNLKGTVGWTSHLTISANRSKVVDLGTDIQGNKIERIDAPVSGGNWFPLFVGKSPFQLYGYEIEGIYQTDQEAVQNGESTKKAGDYKYKDTDGKHGITTGDKTILSRLEPKFVFGFTNRVNWNNFELSILMTGSVGNDIVNEFNKSITNIGGTWNIRKDVWDNHWRPDNPNARYARASADTKDYLAFGDPNSLWVEKGSYLRFKDIQLSYQIPGKVFKGNRKPDITVYVSGQNLITITSYSHYDPEASWTSSSINGWDRGVYPSSKTYTLGLQVKF